MARGTEGRGYHRFFFIDADHENGGWPLFIRTVFHGVYGKDGTKDTFVKHCQTLQEVMRVQDCILPGLT